MKLTKSFEQGVCIIAIIATQTSGDVVSSRTLQNRLNTSMTYSQKILRKLVVAGLIKSIPGNNGGFALAKATTDISVLDVVMALEGEIDSYSNSNLLTSVFHNSNESLVNTAAADEAIHRIFMTADKVWMQVLASISLADIIERVVHVNDELPEIDWNNLDK